MTLDMGSVVRGPTNHYTGVFHISTALQEKPNTHSSSVHSPTRNPNPYNNLLICAKALQLLVQHQSLLTQWVS